MRSFLTLKAYFRRYWARYVFGIGMLLLGDVAQLILPQVLKGFVNALETPGVAFRDIERFAVWTVLLGVGTFAARFLWRQMVTGASRIIDYELRDRLFRHLTLLSPRYFDHHKTGDLMAHATNDLNAVRMALGMGAVTLFDSTFLIVTTVFIMVHTISLPLTLWALLPLPLMALATERLGRIIHRRFLTVQAAFSDVTDATQENFAGIRVIKGFAREAHELERFGAVNRAYFHQNMALVRVWGLLDPLVDFISGVSFATALGYGGMLVLEGRLSLGSFVAFTSYLGLLQWPMMAIGQLMNILQRGAASLERLNAIFREQPEIVEGPVSFAVEGRVEFRHLTFRYDEDQPPVLTDVNVVLEPGQTLGIVGRTGSGKSTLVNLLLRLYDPPPGTVFIDGHDVRELSFATLRESIGYVPSDNFLFSDTIAENVAFGRGEMSRAEIERVTELAQVRENILAFPDQFDTLLGERGITLSGGQKQRVSIARALAKDPAILILDDALSAVDTATEDAILKRLREVRRGRTNIVIAHRISTVQDADRIIVLDGGRVIQSGTHDELLQQDGLYRALYERQLLEARVEAAGAEEGVSA